ncbi:hypothetical protein ACWZJV_05990 [Nocardioides sp. WG-D5]|uniref:hypothetical protein n=1 Tax=Nocardioides luteus TaxID=1844 RepID=UPI000202917C|nr:hypothetical protein [Nocardioides luteus]EGD40277.1 hypothetical protein NBCG_05448 [Nocardioidaceae bacterium Broad-1]MBG6095407.1 hypothetical protein [Nocardioides luteus]
MDTGSTHDHQLAPSSATARPDGELGGHYSPALFEQTLKDSLDDAGKNALPAADAALLTEQFAGIVYFSDMAADRPRRPQSPYRNAAAGAPGGEHSCSTRGRRVPTRPWRLPAGERSPKS